MDRQQMVDQLINELRRNNEGDIGTAPDKTKESLEQYLSSERQRYLHMPLEKLRDEWWINCQANPELKETLREAMDAPMLCRQTRGTGAQLERCTKDQDHEGPCDFKNGIPTQ